MTNAEKYNEEMIYRVISSTLMDYKILMADATRGYLSKMDMGERCAAARNLVFMEEVAKNPAKYFSRRATESDWIARANSYAKEKNITDMRHAYYIVPSPTTLVTNRLTDLPVSVSADLRAEYYRFCEAVKNWEYARTSQDPRERAIEFLVASEIFERANKAAKMVQRHVVPFNCKAMMRGIKSQFKFKTK